MDSSKHGGAYISLPICTNRLIFGKGTFFNLVVTRQPCRLTKQCPFFVKLRQISVYFPAKGNSFVLVNQYGCRDTSCIHHPFPNLETKKELEPKCVPRLFLVSLLGTHQSATLRILGTRMLELGVFPFSSDFAYDPVT